MYIKKCIYFGPAAPTGPDGPTGPAGPVAPIGPNVISCGGTTLISNGKTIIKEKVWYNNTDSTTGGGYSKYFAKPSYQRTIKNNSKKRGTPDVAGNADPYTGYIIYLDGYVIMGGTSAVAPLWAGLNALLNHSYGRTIFFINNKLYKNPKVLNDIRIGKNDLYPAKNGWDLCTGLGSPNGTAIMNIYIKDMVMHKIINAKQKMKTLYDF